MIVIEAISRQHDRKAFDCGVEELNRFLQQQARQKTAKHISKTYVACSPEAPTTIVGYYTLTGYSVTIPPAHKDYQTYPYPLSAVKLARLAVSRDHQGQRFGERLLVDAIDKTVQVAQQIATIGLFVDSMTSAVVPFYEQYGFVPADPGEPSRLKLWLPTKTCEEVASLLLKAQR